ncbi:response regulator receiver modulated diguanylate cyclase/phosphodiesterase [Nitrosococcus oceani ATCC 19707]|uniref:cyclic-guanylate-specific phosphodiesterase n=3 Tax=Nitrosococcus oceani TaxID=1229 RepID=Q3JAB6_NITOC|nr:EAL domain-containing protein [Nitrosococcus oceani]ABA58230.1 response regulator receiver modulated diguanylate cyclase/phosphodiesterase [Nitrosococcus oceani ATCC 19707]EDZ67440.1 PAS fold family [Nitrosococcus oceani AFC27]KFI19344.1 diguanylate phosphodiesterase [Nitrosococcus oceani C-27]
MKRHQHRGINKMRGLRVLIVEDSEDDALLLERHLRRGDYQPFVKRVETRETMLAALQTQPWDIILSDHSLPHFGSMDALTLLQKESIDIPFIMVSGTVGEDRAVEIMKAGAHDYIMKDNLRRLVPAVERELREANIRRQRQAVENERARLSSILEATPDLVAIMDLEGRIHYMNQAGRQWLGFIKKNHYAGASLLAHYPLWTASLIRDTAIPAALREGVWEGEAVILNPSGGEIPVSQVILSHRNALNQVEFLSTIARDISERKHYEQELQYRVTHDTLTHLPNRILLRDRLIQVLAHAKRNQRLTAVLFLDVDNFKQINDGLGHLTGDKCLRTLAHHLAGCIRESDTLGRYGGDEFLIILSDLRSYSDVETLIKKIRATVSQPLKLNNNDVFITLSIGVSLYPQDGDDEEALLKTADAAMHTAKHSSPGQCRYYRPEMNVRGSELLALETDLHRALEREEFVLYYQPQLDVTTGQITAVEALIRWQHPNRGLVSPRDFIPLLEQTGLIEEVGKWGLNTACRQAKAWHSQGYPIRMAVNCSARQFQQHFLDIVHQILQKQSLDPAYLELEVTESVVMQDTQSATYILQRLKEMGVTLAIDDFGTGYSSLAYLKRFPIHSLKIDCSFVRDVTKNEEDAAIAETILLLGNSLGLEVVAEGVETEAQMRFFQDRHCHRIQGYWIGRPMPAKDLFPLITGRNNP